MVFVNSDALKTKLNEEGRKIIITHYSGSQSYDANQNPTRSSIVIRGKAAVHRPNKTDLEINTSLGRITVDDKKLIIPWDIDISQHDEVKFSDCDTETYKVKLVINKEISANITSNIVFISLVK